MGLEAKVQTTAEVVETADVEPVDEEEQMQQEVSAMACTKSKSVLSHVVMAARTPHYR